MKCLVLYPRRAYLSVVFPSVIAAPGHSLADYNPRVVVAEDAGILLVASRIRRDFTHFYVIGCEGGVVEHHAVFAVKVTLARVESLAYHAFLHADAGHGAEALRLDEYLAFFVFMGADLVAVEVIGTEIPLSIPSVLLYRLDHIIYAACGASGLNFQTTGTAQLGILATAEDKQPRYHKRLRL